MSKEIKIGILATIAIVLLVFGFKFLKGKDVFNRNQTFYVEYADVNTLTVSTPVYIHGFQVGIVKNIYFKPDNQSTIVVELEVKKGIQVPKWTTAEIQDVGFMGNKAIDLVFKGNCNGADCAQSGDYLTGKTKGMLTSMLGDPKELGGYMEQLQIGITGILDTVNYYFKTADKSTGIGLAVNNLQSTLQNLEKITTQLSILLQASNQQLQGTFSNLNSITGNISAKNKDISSLLSNLNEISAQVKGSGLDKTIGTATQTFSEANARLKELETTIGTVNSTIDKLSTLINKINDGNGTLGKLINDNDLYTNLERTSKQADLLLQDLRMNPKRYVNVSIFGKKQKQYNLPEDDPAAKLLDVQNSTDNDTLKIKD